jgi:P27 family predicted phage terminase small subunit
MLSNAGVLTVMDVPMLMLYCESWSRYKKAQTEMRKPGQGMVIRNAMGKTRNPWLAILDKAHEQMLKIQLEYGMSPAARTRVRIVATPPAPVKGGAVVPRPGNVFELIKSTAKAR